MGIVMLIGIVVNNAILIMDQFNVHVGEGVPRHKAMMSAACERFRPIVMITLAAVLGMMPLAFGRGIGAEIRNAGGGGLDGRDSRLRSADAAGAADHLRSVHAARKGPGPGDAA